MDKWTEKEKIVKDGKRKQKWTEKEKIEMDGKRENRNGSKKRKQKQMEKENKNGRKKRKQKWTEKEKFRVRGGTQIIKKEVGELENKENMQMVVWRNMKDVGDFQSEEDTRYNTNNELKKIRNNLFLLKNTV